MSHPARTVLVLGADGYLGWPMSMRLSRLGHHVIALDNLSKRGWRTEVGSQTLAPIASMPTRVARWHEITGHTIGFHQVDLRDATEIRAIIERYRPDAVIHFAEQPSAPYSMIDLEHASSTQSNNVLGTLNLLFALHDVVPDCHLIKLGTMGEYGCPDIDIEEGWITIEHNGRSARLPFPKTPHSFYHLSKVHDSYNMMFASRVWGMRATDLNQGVVYGVTTDEVALHPDLATAVHFDTIFGTAVNRFCVQAALGLPITVYGKGGQTRGYLDIRDTLACIELALNTPAEHGEFRVFNQFTEQFSLNQLAQQICEARQSQGLPTTIAHVDNPRVELEEHYYNAKHQKLLDLGLQPHLMKATLLNSMIDWVQQHAHRVDPAILQNPSVTWQGGANEHLPRHEEIIEQLAPDQALDAKSAVAV